MLHGHNHNTTVVTVEGVEMSNADGRRGLHGRPPIVPTVASLKTRLAHACGLPSRPTDRIAAQRGIQRSAERENFNVVPRRPGYTDSNAFAGARNFVKALFMSDGTSLGSHSFPRSGGRSLGNARER